MYPGVIHLPFSEYSFFNELGVLQCQKASGISRISSSSKNFLLRHSGAGELLILGYGKGEIAIGIRGINNSVDRDTYEYRGIQ